MPFLKGRSTEIYYDEKMLVFYATYGIHMSATFLQELKNTEIIEIANKILQETQFPTFEQTYAAFGDKYVSPNNFIIVTPLNNQAFSPNHFDDVLIEWLNNIVLPPILENNKRRVLDAIPTPPQFDIETIFKNLFVLDDASDDLENMGRQGTCFYLEGVGFVTCDHVLTPNMQCFHPQNINNRYDVEIVARNADIDLAILRIDDLVKDLNLNGLSKGSADTVELMDHIAVVGFPNYSLGDTGILSPGLIIGFRPRHGLRRLLINASIVWGNSGGPIIDANNNVIGVAVTGADCSEHADQTENHGVIPIDALQYLMK
jgi:S1-C subfamily serine protease